MKKIFLFGYYGFKNTGDEGILQGIIMQLKKAIPNGEITVLTYKAQETEENYGIKAVSRNHFKDIIKAIKKADIVISGGGSILQDVTSSRSLMYYLGIIYLAKKMGKKVMFYGNGFGPINRNFNKKIAAHIINRVDAITVRDYQSKELMQSLGIHKKIEVTADVTFHMDLLSKEETDKILKQEKINEEDKFIGISVRRWKSQENYKEIIAKTGDYLGKRGYKIIFIPMQHPNDLTISQEIADLMEIEPKIIENKYSPKEIIAIISRLDVLIGMRLHSLIFAAIHNIPMVGLEYDPKISSFLKLVDQNSGGHVERLDTIELWAAIDDTLDKSKEYEEKLTMKSEELHKKAGRNIEILKELLIRR
ncbi:MAG: polysaccharide pyruvyl transferase CsaB [Clostridiaceae bacterium]|nr:polysaccharide pyruvyl transferase CsaB [Clostridiaceae bacterium]